MELLEKKLTGYVDERKEVLIAYLFGSQTTGLTHRESDVDVALLFQFESVPSADQLLQIQDELTSILKKEVDIVVLNDASPIIRMQVLRKGKKLFERDRQAFIRFFVRTVNEYDDLKKVRSVIEKRLQKAESMVDRDVAFAKISSIQRCLKRIHEVTNGNPESLDNLDVQEIVTLNLQRTIQGAIDLAAHFVADEGWGVPQELRENFNLLSQNDVLPEELTKRLRKMVGFRNIAVHEYETINIDILKSILRYNLKDIEEFYLSVLQYYNLTEDG